MNLYIKKSNIHGNGIYTKKFIKKGEVFDESLLNELIKDNFNKIIPTHHYTTVIDNIYRRFLILGPSHYYNHSETPNSEIKLKKTSEGFYYLESISLRDINENEEITILYFEGVKF